MNLFVRTCKSNFRYAALKNILTNHGEDRKRLFSKKSKLASAILASENLSIFVFLNYSINQHKFESSKKSFK
jgi:hypothetical protein